MNVLITGANGFIGVPLGKALATKGYTIRGAFRSKEKFPPNANYMECFAIGGINADTDWSDTLNDIDAVIHLASRVHHIEDNSLKMLNEYRKVNAEGTKRLAEMMIKKQVNRLIFISTIKVNGEHTIQKSFTEIDLPNPKDAYAISKWEAEMGLKDLAPGSGLEFVILRPPLVYGQGVRANFLRLLKIVDKGIPLPFGLIANHRSMIYLGNLIDAVIACIEHPNAANQTFLISDGHDISTPDLIRMIAKAMGKKAKLLPFPVSVLKMLGKITGKSAEIERLTGSLQIDSSKIRKVLGWEPPFTLEEGIDETVKWYLKRF